MKTSSNRGEKKRSSPRDRENAHWYILTPMTACICIAAACRGIWRMIVRRSLARQRTERSFATAPEESEGHLFLQEPSPGYYENHVFARLDRRHSSSSTCFLIESFSERISFMAFSARSRALAFAALLAEDIETFKGSYVGAGT